MEKLAEELKAFGGYLECNICGKKEPIGNIENQLSNGWKKCCGYTMTWITNNMINKSIEK
jgi:hypothetical protein